MVKVILADTYGFCMGVKRAIEIVEKQAKKDGPGNVFIFRDIVHNQHIVDNLRKQGVVSVSDISLIPRGKTVIWPAHGVAPEMWDRARNLGLNIIDATCPLVAKVHQLAQEASQRNDTVIYIGEEGHDEQQGVKAEVKTDFITIWQTEDLEGIKIKDPTKVTVLTQTTLA